MCLEGVREDRGELAAADARADDQQRFAAVGEVDDPFVDEDVSSVDRDARQRARSGAGGDDEEVGLDARAGGLDRIACGSRKRARPLTSSMP